MSNRAASIRAEHADLTVTRRGRRYIEFAQPDGSRRLVATIDPLHYQDAEIDTAWVTDIGAWQYKTEGNSFRLNARNQLNAGDIVQWTDLASSQYVTFQPLALNWVNASDSKEQITQPQSIMAAASDDVLYWANGYGTGRHFRYVSHPTRLIKELIVDAASNLPTPATWLGTGTLWLELEFILKRSAGLTLYINGSAWNNNTKTNTGGQVDFRLANGTTVWRIDTPVAVDSAGNTCPGVLQLRRQSGSYYCTVRIPRTWLQTAVFPVRIDPTLTTAQDTTDCADTYLHAGNATTNYGTDQYDIKTGRESSNTCVGLIRFDLSDIPSGSTCNSATVYLRFGYMDGPSRAYSVYALLRNWVENQATWNIYSTGNNWGTAGASGSGDRSSSTIGTFTCPSSHPNWSSFTLDTDTVEGWFGGSNNGFLFKQTTDTDWTKNAVTPSENATSGNRPYMVVVYTEGGTDASQTGLPASARVGAAAGTAGAGANLAGLTAAVRAGAAAGNAMASASISGRPASARAGSTQAGVSAGANLTGLLAWARAGAAGASVSTGTSVTVTGLPAGARLGNAPGNLSAGANLSGLPASVRAAIAAGVISSGAVIAGLPGSARVGNAGANVSTGTSVTVTGLPASVRIGGAPGILSSGANIIALAAAIRLGTVAASVSTGASVVVTCLPASITTGAAAGSISSGGSVAGLPAPARSGTVNGASGGGAEIVAVPASLRAGTAAAGARADVLVAALTAWVQLGARAGRITVMVTSSTPPGRITKIGRVTRRAAAIKPEARTARIARDDD